MNLVKCSECINYAEYTGGKEKCFKYAIMSLKKNYIVTYHTCEVARNTIELCGPEGKSWEPKDPG